MPKGGKHEEIHDDEEYGGFGDGCGGDSDDSPGYERPETPDSAEINKLLDNVKSEAVQLKSDATDMKSFAASNLTWQSHAEKIEMIKGHINDAGKLLAQLHDAKSTGSPWQQKAIDEIDPLLRDMADNTTATIDHLNKNQSKVHFPAFKAYVTQITKSPTS